MFWGFVTLWALYCSHVTFDTSSVTCAWAGETFSRASTNPSATSMNLIIAFSYTALLSLRAPTSASPARRPPQPCNLLYLLASKAAICHSEFGLHSAHLVL